MLCYMWGLGQVYRFNASMRKSCILITCGSGSASRIPSTLELSQVASYYLRKWISIKDPFHTVTGSQLLPAEVDQHQGFLPHCHRQLAITCGSGSASRIPSTLPQVASYYLRKWISIKDSFHTVTGSQLQKRVQYEYNVDLLYTNDHYSGHDMLSILNFNLFLYNPSFVVCLSWEIQLKHTTKTLYSC